MRTDMDPLWAEIVVGGVEGSKKFLGCVDHLGTSYESPMIATGFGSYLAIGLMRKAAEGHEDDLTEEEAIKLLDDCLRILYYRDCLASQKFQRTKITAAGMETTSPINLDANWDAGERYGTFILE